MAVPFLRPRVIDLVFRVYARPLHPEFFTRRKVRRVERAGFTLTAAITPAGHTLEWTRGGVAFMEVLTATGDDLPATGLRLQRCLDGLDAGRSGRCKLSADVRYEMSLRAETLSPEVFSHVQRELIDDGARRGMLFHTANLRPGESPGSSPVSYLTVDPIAAGLAVSAFHTFPDEFVIVRTQSLVEFPTVGAFEELPR
jgi:hypothetical protein